MLRFDDSPKRATNLTLNAKVLDTAKELGLNISATVDELLTAEVQRRYWQRWNEDNQGAIADYNARIERDGTFSQRIQRFLSEQTPANGSV
jgi:antitoxin CcdA